MTYETLEDKIKGMSRAEATSFIDRNFTKKQLLKLEEDIPNFEGYNWTKLEGINVVLSFLNEGVLSA